MQKLRFKSDLKNKPYYFRFWTENDPNEFWYTETTEAIGFNIGSIKDFEPIGKTWDEFKNN